jgi:hypothetical protein
VCAPLLPALTLCLFQELASLLLLTIITTCLTDSAVRALFTLGFVRQGCCSLARYCCLANRPTGAFSLGRSFLFRLRFGQVPFDGAHTALFCVLVFVPMAALVVHVTRVTWIDWRRSR